MQRPISDENIRDFVRGQIALDWGSTNSQLLDRFYSAYLKAGAFQTRLDLGMQREDQPTREHIADHMPPGIEYIILPDDTLSLRMPERAPYGPNRFPYRIEAVAFTDEHVPIVFSASRSRVVAKYGGGTKFLPAKVEPKNLPEAMETYFPDGYASVSLMFEKDIRRKGKEVESFQARGGLVVPFPMAENELFEKVDDARNVRSF